MPGDSARENIHKKLIQAFGQLAALQALASHSVEH